MNDPKQVEAWFSDAKKFLAQAQTLCSTAKDEVVKAKEERLYSRAAFAKAAFLAADIQSQIETLQMMGKTMQLYLNKSTSAFAAMARQLDTVDANLDRKLASLKQIPVDEAFRNANNTLFDFVDEEAIKGLREQCRRAVYETQQSHEACLKLNCKFSEEVEKFRIPLKDDVSFEQDDIPLSKFDIEEAALPHPIIVDFHIDAMAYLLEALAKHYDQCQLALNDVSQSLNLDFEELFRVLGNDHSEAQAVSQELLERVEETQNVCDATSKRRKLIESALRHQEEARQTIKEFGDSSLHGLIDTHARLQADVRAHEEEIAVYEAELEALVSYYDNFAEAYDAMLIEVGRRRGIRVHTNAILNEALNKVEAIQTEEIASRKNFCEERGNYLPGDIWPGLLDAPTSYQIVANEDALPDLNKEVLEKAMRRIDRRNIKFT